MQEGFNDARLYLESEEWQATQEAIGYTIGKAIGYALLTLVSVALFTLGSMYDGLTGYLESDGDDGLQTLAEMADIYGLSVISDEDGTPVVK